VPKRRIAKYYWFTPVALEDAAMKFFATTIHGLEDVAAAEVGQLIGVPAEVDVAKVFFDSSTEGCAVVNYAARTINKVYLMLDRGFFGRVEEIERAARNVDFTGLIERGQSFAVRAKRSGVHDFTSIDVAAAVGRGVIESYRLATGFRLGVNLNEPDVEILAVVRENEYILGLNTTGESLHRRYYRARYHRSGLSPTVASAMLSIAEWRPDESLLDPFCGSGTIPIEAALKALNIHVGLRRRDLAMERLIFFDKEMLRRVRERLASGEKEPHRLEIAGLDASPKSIEASEENLKRAGLEGCVRFMLGDATRLERYVDWHVDKAVFNPPFGVRMGLRNPEDFYYKSFEAIRRAAPGCRITFIVSKPVVAQRALERAGWTAVSERNVVLGSISAHIISAEH
jgi:tRNA (guanine6-N2)-methyltransferase